MKTKTHFIFRVDIWDDAGDRIVEHVAGADDFELAEAIYRAAVARWLAARITLRQGIRVVDDTGTRVLSQLGQSSPQTRTGGL
jgi:hypothetical protein